MSTVSTQTNSALPYHRVSGRWIAALLVNAVLAVALLRWQPHAHVHQRALRWSLLGVEFLSGLVFLLTVFVAQGSLRDRFELGRDRILAMWAETVFVIAAMYAFAFHLPHGEGLVKVVTYSFLGVAILLVAWAVRDRERPTQVGLIQPPGSKARGWLSFLYSPKDMTLVFEPVLRDIQDEWLADEIAGRRWRARMTRLRGYVQIAQAVVAHGGENIFKTVAFLWKLKE